MRPVAGRSWGRRLTACTAALAALPLTLTLSATAHAADDVNCASTGALYSVTSSGGLLRRSLSDPAGGTGGWPASTTIDTGWEQYPRVLAGPSATFYGIKSDGLYFSHRDASGTWDVHHQKISTGYGGYRLDAKRNKITIDTTGHLWFIDDDGDLRWTRYLSDTKTWEPAGGSKKTASGWGRFSMIVAADDGVLYGVDSANGRLLRSRYDFASQRWLERDREVSAADWRQTEDLTSFGGDVLLRVLPSGEVRHYRFHEDTGAFAPYNDLLGGGAYVAAYTSVAGSVASCRLTASHTPPAPVIAVDPFTPNSVLQAAGGEIEYAYTDNIGRLVHGRQTDPSDFNSVRWATISGDDAFSGRPQLTELTDGRTALTAQNVNSQVWFRRHAASSPDWEDWYNFAGAMAGHPVTARTPAGAVTQFAVDADGKPWYRTDFAGWLPLSGDGLTGSLTAVTVRDGVQLFGTDTTGVLRTAAFSGGAVGAWTAVGDQAVTGAPAVVVYPGYRLGVYARATSGRVVTVSQPSEGAAFPAAFGEVGDRAFAGTPSVVVSPLTGITEIVARSEDGYVYSTGEQTQGSGSWRTWQQVSFESSATDPTAFTYTNASGPTWAYTFRTSSNQTRVYEVAPTLRRSSPAAKAPEPGPAPVFTARALPAPPKR
ncbi:tachylectin-related carbohydrate-binding protein [Streptomyces sp. CA-253872]|uniref:tachylectin-related carbohydrate-binding protein n=1 Tax=Streptomyces sp. CA-253872 TaxID=3240067 RepID=UPI003D93BCD2